MSSKKQLRRQRQEKEEQEREGRKLSPATLFIVGIAAAVLVLGATAYAFRADNGEPPWEGAVWSELHGHWH